MTEEKKCPVCNGTGKIDLIKKSQCTFCNGTGDNSPSAMGFLKRHTCQCFFSDRQTCPICKKKCHHDTPHRPKVLVAPQ